MTNDIRGRTWSHKKGINDGFTKKYACNKLLYYEEYQWVQDAIAREKQLKAGPRKTKVDLINLENAGWNDLSADWYDGWEQFVIASVARQSQGEKRRLCSVRLPRSFLARNDRKVGIVNLCGSFASHGVYHSFKSLSISAATFSKCIARSCLCRFRSSKTSM
jgi:putative endonuclease